MKKDKYADVVVFVLIGVMIAKAVFDAFTSGFILAINFYLGCLCWAVVGFLVLEKGKGSYLVFYMLLLSTLNILVYSVWIRSFGSVHYIYRQGNLIISSVGINPMFLFILVIYTIINIKRISSHFGMLFGRTIKDRDEELKSKVNFYYEKFSSYSSEDLVMLFKMYEEYPVEAQIALKKIHKEKNLTYMEF